MAEEPRGSKAGDESQPWVSSAVLCLALSLSFTSTWLLNAVGYPAVDGFCPQGRLVAPLVGALAAALFSLLSQNHPRLFTAPFTLWATLAGLVVSTAGIYLAVSVFVAGVVFVFCAYNFLFARRFSFDAAAEGLAPLHEAPAVTEPSEEHAPAIERSCEAVAARCQLTARELDVLLLLARGRNAAYIQEELGLTRSTAKSYVADVYRKLDVHSHQELIDVVEGRE